MGKAQGQDQPRCLIMPCLTIHQCSCQTVSNAELKKAFSALLMSQKPGVLHAKQRDPSCELEESEFCSTHGVVKEILHPQNRLAGGITYFPQAQEITCYKQKGATSECEANEDVQKVLCSSNRSVKEPHDPEGRSATRNKQKRTLGGFLALVKWIRSHPVLTLAVLTLLLLLAVALAVSLAAVSERRHGDTPVTAVTPDTPLLLACPHGWVGYHGICYFLSSDRLTWDQAKARCSELGASLAVLEDWEMEFLFNFSRNNDYWLGLHRQDQQLQWVDGSNFNSSVPALGNAPCVYLAENYLWSGICSNDMQYICSRLQTPTL